jgi:DNA polymerase elongation subunit (family B)
MDKIVSIEIGEEQTEIFFKGGLSELVPTKLWITSSDYQYNWKKLSGNLPFKYGISVDSPRKFYTTKKRDNIYTINNLKSNFMSRAGINYYKDLKFEEVSLLGFDIETSGLLNSPDKRVFIIANTFLKNGIFTRKMFSLDKFSSEFDMLKAWCEWVREINPDILLNHNIFGFDLPYLMAIGDKYNYQLELGRDGSAIKQMNYESSYRVDGTNEWTYRDIKCYGREIIDTMFLAVKYDIGRNFPSWGLKPIADYLAKEAGAKKNPTEFDKYVASSQDGRVFYDVASIKDNWTSPTEREKIKKYAEFDGDDAIMLFRKMAPPFFYLCRVIPMPFQLMMQKASGAWINSMLISEYIRDAHSLPKADPESSFVAGGMSYGVPGIYNNVVKFDANSYYPSTMLTFNIGPGANKDPLNKFLEMVKRETNKRFEYKKEFKLTNDDYYDNMQAASKVLINSAYGALGTKGLNFNNFDSAALITKCCRKGLQKAVEWATGKNILNWWPEYSEQRGYEQDFLSYDYIDEKATIKYNEMERLDYQLCNIDTDALSFCKPNGAPFSREEYESVQSYLNKIMYCNWEEDGTFDSFIVLKAKNYVMRTGNYIKFKGSSITDSKKEKRLTRLLKDCLESLSHGRDEIVKLYEDCVNDLIYNFKIEEWSTKKSITSAVLTNDRTNERVVREAFNGRTFTEGNKIFVYYAQDKLKMSDDYDGTVNLKHYLGRIYDTMSIMENVIEMDLIKKYYTNKLMKGLLDDSTKLQQDEHV